jgi:hypothetical protein
MNSHEPASQDAGTSSMPLQTFRLSMGFLVIEIVKDPGLPDALF